MSSIIETISMPLDKAFTFVHSFYPLPKEDFLILICSFWCWTLGYMVLFAYLPLEYFGKPKKLILKPQDDLDVRNRLPAIFHGSTLFLLSANLYYRFPGGCGDENSLYAKRLIYFAVGYFQYDFWAMVYYGLIDGAMTMHHWACIIGMSLPLTYGMSANYIVMGMFVAEGSNAFMHIRAILRHFGLRFTKLYEFIEISFMTIYIFCRIFLGARLVWRTCLCEHNHIVSKIAAVGLIF